MGRVLVFTLPTCTHCRAAKATLARRGVPYVEVSLSAHPTRRGDMESLSNRATVPQIFLNDHHVGGASDLQTLIDADPDAFDARARAALAAPDPADPRLAAPAPDDADDERTRGSLAPSRDDRTARVPSHPRPVILTLAGEPIDHVAAVALLREILPLEDRPWNLTVFRRCVPGSVAVDAMLSRFGTRAFASREDAVDALRRLQRAGVLCHVRDEHPFDDVPDLFYRLAPDQSPSTVNGSRADAEAIGGLDGGVVRRAGARGGFPSSHRANPQPTRGRDDRSRGVRGGGVGSRVARFSRQPRAFEEDATGGRDAASKARRDAHQPLQPRRGDVPRDGGRASLVFRTFKILR